ncbi:MAG: S-methyl-5-thioribose-1-phosphate isomerase [Acidobacteria bacterium]|nr:S-methyl-5-thioribose-1-phosphate isomerase [Acidobacteriota bacterium]
MIRTIEWTDQGVSMIDQRRLPNEEVYNFYQTHEQVADAIRSMVIRGAPAIGVAAAMGVALGVKNLHNISGGELESRFEAICQTLAGTRPTAVNLFWAIERLRRAFDACKHRPLTEIQDALREEALQMRLEDVAINRRMGEYGQVLLPDSATVLTHCNAGALATAGFGTALGVVRAAVNAGKSIRVLAGETRPFLQGARLTVWELMKDNIPVTLITDNMAGHLMKTETVDAVIVGADRIAADGDVANKIGTYSVAILARAHGIPFYVAAPMSTIDFNTPTGSAIPIEQRSASEVLELGGRRIAPDLAAARNPAFDVTPAEYVSAIITENGVARAPYLESLRALAEKAMAVEK